MNKFFAFIGLALFVVATSALEQECPTTRSCCTCECTPKGCPFVPRPENCNRVKCLLVCPHKCIDDLEFELGVTIKPDNTTCPTTLPCCSCKKVPKGCPEPQRPKHCKIIGHCPVCPPHQQEQEQPQPMALTETNTTCLKTASCCYCNPKGCPEPTRPNHCKMIHCPVCPPHHQEQEQPEALMAIAIPPNCPKTRLCCSCEKTPKGCPEPPRPKGCEHMHCPVCPPHQQEVPEALMAIAIPPNCPKTRLCCTCERTPKGCPEPPRPKGCEHMHCPVCPPHQQEVPEALMAIAIPPNCPTTRPCCTCKKVPKGCPEPPRPKGCERVHCPVCPPHQQEEEPMVMEIAMPRPPPFVCPTERPCCTCQCPPKGCPIMPRPDHCKRIKCKFVCPHPCH